MTHTTASHKHDASTSNQTHLDWTKDAVASARDGVRRSIIKNPGMSLAISAAIGVILACLIKRK
jgi:ElaB/YqjD/DUF883 family membrane-anchored ribosome-binding protein